MGHCSGQLDPRSDDHHVDHGEDGEDGEKHCNDDEHDCHGFDEDSLEDDGCEPMKGPRSEPQMMSMHEEHKKIEVGIPIPYIYWTTPCKKSAFANQTRGSSDQK